MTLLHRSRLAGLVAVALAAATGLVGLSATSATAAVCGSNGISAVVDGNGAGGGVSTACVKGTSAKKAAAVFQAAGVEVRRNRDGSVCQVNGLPDGAPCSGLGNQYWALFWSDGTNGKWIYAQQGDTSLSIPKNGSVAWAWQSSSTKREPGAAPPVIKATPTPKPTPKPTKKPTPTKQPTAPKPTKSATSTATARAAATASARASASASARKVAESAASTAAGETPSASASASTGEEATDQASPAVTSAQKASSAFKPEDEHSGLPAWVPVGVIVVLGGAAGGAVWWRRRTGAA